MSKVLVIAPHPDDETLGCGGSILRHINNMDEVYWLIMTTMETSGCFSKKQFEKRTKEIEKVAANYGFDIAYDFKPGKNFFGAADLGWIGGHSIIMYGALIRGALSIIFEGKPTVPHPGILWEIIEKHKIHNIFIAPTATRELMRVDHNGDWIKKYDVSSLEVISVAGERTDP